MSQHPSTAQTSQNYALWAVHMLHGRTTRFGHSSHCNVQRADRNAPLSSAAIASAHRKWITPSYYPPPPRSCRRHHHPMGEPRCGRGSNLSHPCEKAASAANACRKHRSSIAACHRGRGTACQRASLVPLQPCWLLDPQTQKDHSPAWYHQRSLIVACLAKFVRPNKRARILSSLMSTIDGDVTSLEGGCPRGNVCAYCANQALSGFRRKVCVGEMEPPTKNAGRREISGSFTRQVFFRARLGARSLLVFSKFCKRIPRSPHGFIWQLFFNQDLLIQGSSRGFVWRVFFNQHPSIPRF